MDSLISLVRDLFHNIEKYHYFKTKFHEERTGNLMLILGEALNFENDYCTLLKEIGNIHDIGKIVVSEEILKKTSNLTLSEQKIIETHSYAGYYFIKQIPHPDIARAAKAILNHHENYDGTGYPNGIKGDHIPLEAQICAISDVYDALREARPYRSSKTHQEAFNLMFDKSSQGLFHKFNARL